MAKISSQKLEQQLFEALNVGDANAALDKLKKRMAAEPSAIHAVQRYAFEGNLPVTRAWCLGALNEIVQVGDLRFNKHFERGLRDDAYSMISYYSLLALLKTRGSDVYGLLVETFQQFPDRSVNAYLLQALSQRSKHQFDLGLKGDAGHWSLKEVKKRLPQVLEWAKAGFREGLGYNPIIPARDAALDNPQTPLEHLMVKLEQRLQRIPGREGYETPKGWLSPANPDDLKRITTRYRLPEMYLEFLTRFSPFRVDLEIFGDSVPQDSGYNLFGASELEKAQEGWHWIENYLVIAQGFSGHAVVVLDLSKSNGQDAPVLSGYIDGGGELGKAFPSFQAFLEGLVVQVES
jgi:hypothetical protein